MQQDYKTLIIYVLTLFVVVLLIVLKKQQDHLSELENEVILDEKVELVLDSLDPVLLGLLLRGLYPLFWVELQQ